MKRTYIKPQLKAIKIDNQISMVMMSVTPPAGPGELVNMQQINNSNPYKIIS
jgi:hypothetical protein